MASKKQEYTTLLGQKFYHGEIGVLHSLAHAIVDSLGFCQELHEIRIRVHKGKLTIQRYLAEPTCIQTSVWRDGKGKGR